MSETRIVVLYRCPTDVRGPDDIIGCAAVFEGQPDDEGLLDCPECGIWFVPRLRDTSVVYQRFYNEEVTHNATD